MANIPNKIQNPKDTLTDELKEMVKLKLYTINEIKKISMSRKEYKTRLINPHIKLEEYFEYINFEKALIQQVIQRRCKKNITEGKNVLDTRLVENLKQIYENAVRRFPGNVDILKSFFKFCKQYKYIAQIKNILKSLTTNCAHDENCWLLTANWYAHDQNNLTEALKILHKGLSIHKEGKSLYTETIKLELSVMKDVTKGTPEFEHKQEKLCEKLSTYIPLIFNSLTNDYNYLISLLHLLEPYSFTIGIQQSIIKHLLENHSDKEMIWHTLAIREKKGFHYELENKSLKNVPAICAIYKEGLQKIKADRKMYLWTMYLDCLIEKWHETNKATDKNELKLALEEASNEKCLQENYYITWLDLVSDEEVPKILQKGVTDFPESRELWELRLQYATIHNSVPVVNKIFKLGILELKENALPLWSIIVRYHTLVSGQEVTNSIFRDAIRQPEPICNVFKSRYIEWIALNKGMEEARQVYTELADKQPYSKELHYAMAKLEWLEYEPNMDIWTSVYRNATDQFGKVDVDVWIDYILFSIRYNKTDLKDIEEIREAAETKLNPLLLDDFKEKYTTVMEENYKNS